MFDVGEEVRLNASGRVITGCIGHGPKAIAFFYGPLIVRSSHEEFTWLHYPVGLDIEYADMIDGDRKFCLFTDHLERVTNV